MKIGKIRKFKASSLLDISIILYAVKYFLDFSTFEKFDSSILSNLLLYASLLVYCVYLMSIYEKAKITFKVFLLQFLFVGVIVLIRYNITYTIYVMYFIFIIGSKYSNPEQVLKTIIRISAFLLMGLAILSIMGVIPNLEDEPGRYSLGLKTREIGWFYLNICCGYFYINRYCLKKRMFILAAIINLIIFSLTRTRLSAILVFVYIVMVYILWKKRIIFKRCLKITCRYIFFFLMLLTVFLTMNFTRLSIITDLLVGRTKFAMRVLTNEGISLFPRNIIYELRQTSAGYYSYYVDSGYMDLLIRFGIIITIVLISLYSYILWKAIKEKNWMLSYWLVCVAVFNVINCSFMNIFLESSMLFIWEFVSNNRNRVKSEELKWNIKK